MTEEIEQAEGLTEEKIEKVAHSTTREAIHLFKSKRFAKYIPYIILAFIIWLGSFIRTRNLNLLKDATTGNYIPLALDPYYFLRLAEILLEQGAYPILDTMRGVPIYKGFTHELLPRFLVWMHNFLNLFGDFSIGYIDVISPVIFFALGLIVFFFLIKALTNTKVALLSSAFLSVIPLYLYRTMAGFADHEAPGMLFFFLSLLSFVYIYKSQRKKYLPYILALVAGIFAALTYGAWAGVATYVFMIIPLAVFLAFILRKTNRKIKICYIIWAIISLGVMSLMFNLPLSKLIGISYMPLLFVFGLLFFDLIIFDLILKNKKNNIKIPHEILSTIVILIIGLIFVSVFLDFGDIVNRLLHPFGTRRLELTVAENRQPYFGNWVSQMGSGFSGNVFFWLFFFGMITIFYEAVKHFTKHKIILTSIFLISIIAIIFSRYSQNSFLNGENFISQTIYFIGIILFFGFLLFYLYTYFKERSLIREFRRINFTWILTLSWLFLMLLSARGAIRLFFITAPFVCFAASLFILKTINFIKMKDDLLKLLGIIIMVIVLISGVASFALFTTASYNQAQYTGPSADRHWQNAMSWVRDNTEEDAVFAHWWDYGYWVQYLGERATVTDGGHPSVFWDHLLGRHFLCAQDENEALEFLYAHEVDYVLIDPTDIGKYPAYSSIGGDSNLDTLSFIPTFILQESQTQETKNETKYVYTGSGVLDDDLVLENKFLPGRDDKGQPHTGVIGLILSAKKLDNNELQLTQPEIVLAYSGQQEKAKIRYVYVGGKLNDFGSGIESAIYVIPRVTSSGLNNIGAALYLPERAMRTQWVRLYLLDETENFDLMHSEPSPTVQSIKDQGLDVEDIIIYNGVKGPIKIWKVEYPSGFTISEELKETYLKKQGSYDE